MYADGSLRSSSNLPRNLILAGTLVWVAAVVAASASGWLSSLSPPAPPPMAAATLVCVMLVYWSLPGFRRYIASVGLRRLTALHALRIAAVPLFFWYGSRGLLPRVFADRAGWGDLAVGLLALAVAIFWPRVAGYWMVHVAGMVDFGVAFGTAMALTRHDPMAVHAVTGLPMALIPFFGVGFLAATHVMAYGLLLRAGRVERNGSMGMTTEAA